jgi:2-dehydro-3-deoxygluconokinase
VNTHNKPGVPRRKAVCVGECMVELARGSDDRFGFAVGGDTFNTAIYLSRAGLAVAYITALGDDPYSQAIVDQAVVENVDTGSTARLPGRLPGLYLIETDARGERSFYYWRDTSPAREVFSDDISPALQQAFNNAAFIYFSGITLWLYERDGMGPFLQAIAEARLHGARIAFDSNYRPRLWGADREPARNAFAYATALADIALPSLDDERALWGDLTAEDVLDRYVKAGVAEIVIKDGAAGAYILETGAMRHIPCPEPVVPVDTTAAGDSFNAAYLAARVGGASRAEAVLLGHRLSAIVVSHRGAIVPEGATTALVDDLRRRFPSRELR